MDAIQVIKERRSVRSFKDERVPREVMEEVIDAVRFAPSWTNTQISRWTLVENEDVIEEIAAKSVKGFTYNIDSLKSAKGVAVLSFVKGKSGKLDKYGIEGATPEKWEFFDTGIACQTFTLAAHAKGVGTCIFGVIDEEAIAKLIDLPEEETVSSIIIYGYADNAPKAPRRKDVSELLRWI